MIRIIDINEKNIDEQELFCKKSKKKFNGYQSKLKWVKERFKEGLKYKLLLIKEGNKETSRGMIEYIPGKYNWRGIKADGWMVIHCLWVVGKAKKHGYGSQLMELAIKDAKETGMYGVVGMSALKGGWLPNTKIFLNHGFEKVDEIDPYFELYVKKFSDNVPLPKFYPISEDKKKEYKEGVTILYSDQCPYVVDLVNELRDEPNGNKIKSIKLNDCNEAQENGIYSYGTYCIIYNGSISLYKHATRKEIQAIINQ